MSGRFACIWQFHVAPASREAFLLQYGPRGSWAQLFRAYRGYLGTELLQDIGDPDRFLTVDSWESEQSYRAFRSAAAAEYERLDALCEGLTTQELLVGAFHQPGG